VYEAGRALIGYIMPFYDEISKVRGGVGLLVDRGWLCLAECVSPVSGTWL
jgi:hypothetical protein